MVGSVDGNTASPVAVERDGDVWERFRYLEICVAFVKKTEGRNRMG